MKNLEELIKKHYPNYDLNYKYRDHTTIPISTVKAIIADLDSSQLEPPVSNANGVNMDECFFCGERASELTHIRIAIKPPNTPNRWKTIGVACNSCADKNTMSIDPSRLSC